MLLWLLLESDGRMVDVGENGARRSMNPSQCMRTDCTAFVLSLLIAAVMGVEVRLLKGG